MLKKIILSTLFFASILEAKGQDPLITIGSGLYNITGRHRRMAFEFEYKFAPFYWHLRPQVGGFITEQATTCLYGGIACDFYLVDKFVVTPSFSPSLYFKGNGKDLGLPLEFRSALSVAVERDGFRLGAEIFHLSHAHIFTSFNPGVNVLMFYLAIPLRFSK